MLYSFNSNARLHLFGDGSGVAVYSAYSGDTVCLRATQPVELALPALLQNPPFSLHDLAQAFAISDNEAARVLEYLQDNNLLENVSGN